MARIRETFGTHSNTAHAWANGNYSHGRSGDGRVFFRDGILFSHGTHFWIAHILPDKFHGRRVVLWNRNRYSISTAKHQSHARGALHGLHDLIVPVADLGRHDLDAKQKRESWESLIVALAADSDGRLNDWNAPDYAPRAALEAFRWHYKTPWPIPADPAAHVARRKAEAARKKEARKVRDALHLVKRARAVTTLNLPEYDPADSSWRLNDTLRGFERQLTDIRSARTTLGKAKRYGASVRKLSAVLKAALPTRDALRTAHGDAVKRERRESDLATLAEFERDSAASEPRHVRMTWLDASSQAHYWSLALETGRDNAADLLRALVQTKLLDREYDARFPRPIKQYGEVVTLEEWRAGKGSAHAQIKGLDRYSATTPTLVRKLGDRLQTSRGAETTWRDAKRVFLFAQTRRRKADPWHRNGEQFRVGPYNLDAIDSEGNVTAGCHRIPWHEMEACAVREFEPQELPATFPLPVPVKGV